MNIQLVTGNPCRELGEIAIGVARARFPDHVWGMLVLDGTDEALTPLRKHLERADVLVSFLNPHIFSDRDLQAMDGRAYNVHPSTPDYPGSDPMHFAFYDRHYVAGATLHVMTTEVDAGPICAVAEQPVDRSLGLPAFSALCRELALEVFLDNLPLLLEDQLVPNGRQWTDSNRRSHKDFLDMCRIDFHMPQHEVERRIEAFYHPRLSEGPYIELHGRRFAYRG